MGIECAGECGRALHAVRCAFESGANNSRECTPKSRSRGCLGQRPSAEAARPAALDPSLLGTQRRSPTRALSLAPSTTCRRLQYDRRDKFDRVVIETTGLANPAPIIQVLCQGVLGAQGREGWAGLERGASSTLPLGMELAHLFPGLLLSACTAEWFGGMVGERSPGCGCLPRTRSLRPLAWAS